MDRMVLQESRADCACSATSVRSPWLGHRTRASARAGDPLLSSSPHLRPGTGGSPPPGVSRLHTCAPRPTPSQASAPNLFPPWPAPDALFCIFVFAHDLTAPLRKPFCSIPSAWGWFPASTKTLCSPDYFLHTFRVFRVKPVSLSQQTAVSEQTGSLSLCPTCLVSARCIVRTLHIFIKWMPNQTFSLNSPEARLFIETIWLPTYLL